MCLFLSERVPCSFSPIIIINSSRMRLWTAHSIWCYTSNQAQRGDDLCDDECWWVDSCSRQGLWAKYSQARSEIIFIFIIVDSSIWFRSGLSFCYSSPTRQHIDSNCSLLYPDRLRSSNKTIFQLHLLQDGYHRPELDEWCVWFGTCYHRLCRSKNQECCVSLLVFFLEHVDSIGVLAIISIFITVSFK